MHITKIQLQNNLQREINLLETVTEKHSRPVHMGSDKIVTYDMLDLFDTGVSLGIDLFGANGFKIISAHKIFTVEPKQLASYNENVTVPDFQEWISMTSLDETKYKISDLLSRVNSAVECGLSADVSYPLTDNQYAYLSFVTKMLISITERNQSFCYTIRYNGIAYNVSLTSNSIGQNFAGETAVENYNTGGRFQPEQKFCTEDVYKPSIMKNICMEENKRNGLKYFIKLCVIFILGYFLFSNFMTNKVEEQLAQLPVPKIARDAPINLNQKQDEILAEIHFRKSGEFPAGFKKQFTTYKDLNNEELMETMNNVRKDLSDMNARIEYIDNKMETPLEISKKIDAVNTKISNSSEKEFIEYVNWMTLEELQLYLEILKTNLEKKI